MSTREFAIHSVSSAEGKVQVLIVSQHLKHLPIDAAVLSPDEALELATWLVRASRVALGGKR